MAATTTLIGDVTIPNPDFRFVNDVRLSQYPDDPDNLALARAYQWTNQQIGRDELPSVQVLQTLCTAFEYEQEEPRRVLQATYGHGKSHLALALANFFGQPSGSAEVEAVLAGVKHVAPGVEARLRTFKADRSPYLVLRLTGGGADSLSAAVVRGFETALQENPDTKDVDLGLWFDKALATLNNFTPEQVAQANAYLDIHAASENLDLGALRATLQGELRDGRHRELTHKLVEHILKVYPNFGAALSPRELMNHMGREFCGPGKPFAGILVLFDEFAAFVEAYARRYGLHTESLPLQSLLDGVSDLRQAQGSNAAKLNKAVFLAFSQQDPDDVAELAMQERGAGKSALADLKKELTRLPNEARNPLYSPMEAVLDAYLKQEKSVWDALTPDDSIADNDVIDAVDAVRNFFPQRYTDSSGWDLDRIRVTMAYGCHPFHPLTTALLCSATLRAGSGARTVLSFVKDTMQHCKRRPAVSADGRLCWVRPIALVEYYKHQLVADDAWKQYETTLRKASTAKILDTEAILQAILLYETAGFKPGDTDATDYTGALAILTGLPRVAVAKALTHLDNAGYIEYDSVSETYRFWANNQDGSQVRLAVAEGLERLKRDEAKWLSATNDGMKGEDASFAPIGEVTFHNTTGGDWGARIIFVPRLQWSAARLASLLKQHTLEPNGKLADAARGYVLVPLTADDIELQWVRQHAETTLNQAIASFTERQQIPAVVAVLPKKPQEALINGLLELNVLASLSDAQKRALGTEPITQRRTTVRNNVQSALDALRDELRRAPDYQVPSLHRPGVESRLTGKRTINLAHVLQAAYETVYYRFAPYLGDSTRGTNLRAAVGLAVSKLYKGTFIDWEEAARNMGRARDLYSKVLRVGSHTSWGVVDTSERVVKAKLPLVKHAWDVLDAAVPPGAENKPLRPALLELLNAPYGYDAWSLGLLFAAWYGVNRHELKITDRNDRPVDYKTWLGNNNDFRAILENMLHTYDLRASRRNEVVEKGEVQDLVTKLRYSEQMPLAEAEIAVQQLSEYADKDGGDTDLRRAAEEAAKQLSHELKQAQEYEKRVTEGLLSLDSVGATPAGIKQLTELCQLFSDPSKVGVPLGLVIPPSKGNIAQAQKRASAKLRQYLTDVCNEFANIASLRAYDLSKQRLAAMLTLVAPLGEPDLERRIRDAEVVLQERHDEFGKVGQDAEIREKVTEARRAGTLSDWRELLNYFDSAEPKADSTIPMVAEAVLSLTTKRKDAEEWLLNMEERAGALTEAAAITAFERELNRKAAQFEGTPQAEQIKELERQAERVTKLLSNLKDQRREKPKTADEVRKVVREYERLAAREGLAEAQIALIGQERADFELRFEEQRQAARQKLDELIANNEALAPPAALLSDVERRLEFLPDEDKPRRDILEKDLRRRVAKDKASVAEKAFLDIGNRVEQRACLARLQQLLELQSA